MKRLLILFLFTSCLLAMEQKVEKFEKWSDLDQEIQALILSHVPEVTNYHNWVNLLSVSKTFNKMATDQNFLDAYAKRIGTHNPEGAVELLLEAANHKNQSLVRALRQANSELQQESEELLRSAAVRNQQSLAATLLKAGVNINASDGSDTPLRKAIRDGRDREMIKWLINNKADVNTRSLDGSTPLMDAVRVSPTEIVEMLINAGADVNVTDSNHRTALDIAQLRGRLDVAQLLEAAEQQQVISK